MDLTHLDDVQPPTPDPAMRSRVVKTARRRRHVRFGLESAAALVVIAVVVSSVVVARSGNSSVRVSTQPEPTKSSNVQTFAVPSASMAPTLDTHERISIDTSWQNEQVERGDIIVFKAPPGESTDNIQDLVKRVIGLPGDKLSVRDRHVFIVPAGESTGYELNEPYVKNTPDCPAGTQSPIAGRTLRPITVPAGEYFVMGDNRCASEDSRGFGSIKQSSIIGLAFVHIDVAPNTVTVQLELDHTSVVHGRPATGVIVFTNTTGHDVVYTSKAGCLSMYALAVGPSRPDVFWRLDCPVPTGPIGNQQRRRSSGPLDLAPGVTRVSFAAPTTYLECSPLAGRNPVVEQRCLANGAMPPLPRGRSYVWFLVDPDSTTHPVLPAPLPITIK